MRGGLQGGRDGWVDHMYTAFCHTPAATSQRQQLSRELLGAVGEHAERFVSDVSVM